VLEASGVGGGHVSGVGGGHVSGVGGGHVSRSLSATPEKVLDDLWEGGGNGGASAGGFQKAYPIQFKAIRPGLGGDCGGVAAHVLPYTPVQHALPYTPPQHAIASTPPHASLKPSLESLKP